MKKPKPVLCPVCKNKMTPIYMPDPYNYKKFAFGIVNSKNELRIQFRCSSCLATVYKDPSVLLSEE